MGLLFRHVLGETEGKWKFLRQYRVPKIRVHPEKIQTLELSDIDYMLRQRI
jgi:hypothetical protein